MVGGWAHDLAGVWADFYMCVGDAYGDVEVDF
jgi:hypothetical protein